MKTKQNCEKLTMTDFSFKGKIISSFSIFVIYSFVDQFYPDNQTIAHPLSDYSMGLTKIIDKKLSNDGK